jgi:glycerate dehydrogenase
VVSLHCPLTDNTHHLICRDTLKLMKPTAILINTGRGPLVCEEDVAEALNAGSLYAYCADVLSKEPADAENPLLKCPTAYITPHIAWATQEARTRLIDVAVSNVSAFLDGAPQNVISA